VKKSLVLAFLALVLSAPALVAAELVTLVRMKLTAGDLQSGIAGVSEYRKEKGVDAEYLNAVGWLARGAVLLDKPELAQTYVAELRREIPEEKEELLTPYGAAIEVESRLIAARDGRGPAIRYLEAQLARAKATSLQSRISKNINLLALEGQAAPPVDASSLASLKGKPVLLFFWAHWCGDCLAQSAPLGRVWQKYRERGLAMLATTRLYGTVAQKDATPAEEKAELEKVWKEKYAALADVPIVISTEAMVRYGASATPTFALVDRRGVVRMYTPTRLSEEELSRWIEEVLAEGP